MNQAGLLELSDLHAVGEKLPVPWLYIGLDGRFRYANSHALNMIGQSADEFFGRHYFEMVASDANREDVPPIIDAALAGVPGGYDRYRYDFRVGASRWFHVHVTADINPAGVVVGAFLLVIDIHAKREAEQASLAAADRLVKHIDTSAAAFIELNDKLVIQRWSRRASQMFGIDASQAIGRSPRQLGAIDLAVVDEVESMMLEKFKQPKGTTWSHRNQNTRIDGFKFWCDWYHTIVTGENGQPAVVTIGVDVSEAVSAREALDRVLRQDPLTGLPNRSSLQSERSESLRLESDAVICINVRGFRFINERYGFAFGDDVLRAVSARLKSMMLPNETVAKHSGADFLVLVRALPDLCALMQRARQLASEVNRPVEIRGLCVSCVCGLGLSRASLECNSFHELLRQAEIAAHQNRRSATETVVLYSKASEDSARANHDCAIALESALVAGELEAYFQPILSIEGRVVGAECLARWRKSDGREVSPNTFIPIAENYGLISRLGSWIFQQACEFSMRVNNVSRHPVRVSANVSPLQLRDAGFEEQISRIMRDTGVTPSTMCIEITESQELVEETTMQLLVRLRDEVGLACCVDDFGVGYSNLRRLIELPISEIKIDRSLVSLTDERSQCVLESIVNMARAMNVSVAAEGVETTAELDAIRRAGCDSYQGFLFAQAVPSEIFICNLLTRWSDPGEVS